MRNRAARFCARRRPRTARLHTLRRVYDAVRNAAMPKIVISYRRSDSDAIAGRIRDRLANQYGEGAIFMDIDSIPLGIDFRQHVQGALSQSDLVIAVVGPKWLGARHRARARIMEDNDPVRIEIETALQSGVRLIPVLVNHATMPKPSDLPKSLEQFAYHNAAEVDAGRDFHQHMERLIRSTDEILGLASRSPIAPARLSRKWLMTAASFAMRSDPSPRPHRSRLRRNPTRRRRLRRRPLFRSCQRSMETTARSILTTKARWM